MYRYSFKGHCSKSREIAFCEVEKIIKAYGDIVAYNKLSDTSMNLMIEMPEEEVESMIFYLEKYMSLSDLKKNKTESGKECKVLINLLFAN